MHLVSDQRLVQLLELLSQNQYESAAQLSSYLEVSSKTVRRMMKELDDLLKKYSAGIESKHGHGYKIKVTNKECYQTLRELLKEEQRRVITPSTTEERVQFLVEYLLNQSDFIKLEDLAEQMYISKNTLSSDLKKVEKILQKYHLTIVRRPSHGILLQGEEFDRRLCMANRTTKQLLTRLEQEDKNAADKSTASEYDEEKIRLISEIIINTTGKSGFKINDMAFRNLVVHIYIAMLRIDQNYMIAKRDGQIKGVGTREKTVAEDIVQCLEEAFATRFSDGEIEYIAIHLAGKQVYEFLPVLDQNIVIHQDVSDLVTAMLQSVYEYFKKDFRDHLELRMILSQHLVPLVVRIEHDLKLQNPLLESIKMNHSYSYMMAAQACMVISEAYGKILSEDEIGYIALPFVLAMEREKNQIVKKNILFVCSTGKGSAELLVYKLKEEFGKYIDQIQVCDLYGINEVDFSKLDYIFTTVPIPIKVPIPIMEVSFFLETKEIEAMKKVFLPSDRSSTEHYFRAELFFPELKSDSKEGVLQELCEKTAGIVALPKRFYQAVLTREHLAKTDFGNWVALPHPYLPITDQTFISVGILEQPVRWTDSQVQVVFLISIAEHEIEDMQQFYQTIVRLVSGKQYIQRLIKEPCYQTLKEILLLAEREGD